MHLHKFTRMLIIVGLLFSALSIIASVVLHIGAGRFGNYYVLHPLSLELITATRQCFGITCFGTIISEIIARHK